MKKLLILGVAITTMFMNARAQEKIEWMGINEAMVLSQQEPRKIIVDVYTDWCGWCKVMDRTTFSDSNIIKYMNEKFYAVKFNAEQKEDITLGDKTYKFINNGSRGYHELAAVLLNGKLVYPSTVVINEKSAIIDCIQSYLEPCDFDMVLKFYGGNHNVTSNIVEFRKTYVSPIPKLKR